jgi:hypothetical protein
MALRRFQLLISVLFRRLHQRIGKIVHVPIHDERGHRVIQCLCEGCGSGFAMDTTRHQVIGHERIHRPLLVGVKL